MQNQPQKEQQDGNQKYQAPNQQNPGIPMQHMPSYYNKLNQAPPIPGQQMLQSSNVKYQALPTQFPGQAPPGRIPNNPNFPMQGNPNMMQQMGQRPNAIPPASIVPRPIQEFQRQPGVPPSLQGPPFQQGLPPRGMPIYSNQQQPINQLQQQQRHPPPYRQPPELLAQASLVPNAIQNQNPSQSQILQPGQQNNQNGSQFPYQNEQPNNNNRQPVLMNTSSLMPVQPQNDRPSQFPQNVPTQQNMTHSTASSTAGYQNQQIVQRNPIPPVIRQQPGNPSIATYQAPKIQNLVSTATLNCQLDLKEIGYQCRNAQYNPKRFAALIMRLREPARTTALIFKNGKMVITGAKSEKQSEDAAKIYAKAIKGVGNNVKLTDFKVQNMVASCAVSFKIALEKLYQSPHQQFSIFNPETFPGLIYHMTQPKICLLIFASGKIVLTGAKNRQDIDLAFQKIQPTLKQFIKLDLRDERSNQGNLANTQRR